MPALAKPSPWASLAKEIPGLVARQLEDNKPPTITLLSSGSPWYMSAKFWVITGIVVGILAVIGGGLVAVSGSERRLANPPSLVAAEEERQEGYRQRRAESARRAAEDRAFEHQKNLRNEESKKKMEAREKLCRAKKGMPISEDRKKKYRFSE
jgi:hypothetical protein